MPHFIRSPTGRAAPELVTQAVSRAKAGDMSAIHFLYVRFADDVFAYVRSVVHDTPEAEDITQNVFAKLGSAIQRYEPGEVPFTAWLLRVARNAALDQLRGRRQIPVEDVRTEDAMDRELGTERVRALRDALSRLPPDQREVLVLRHLVGLSPVDIAARLGKTESSVHGLHHRGRSTLRLALREMDAGPVAPGA
jgi:RNA polymerase sigma-70 factor, ECF subfamily